MQVNTLSQQLDSAVGLISALRSEFDAFKQVVAIASTTTSYVDTKFAEAVSTSQAFAAAAVDTLKAQEVASLTSQVTTLDANKVLDTYVEYLCLA